MTEHNRPENQLWQEAFGRLLPKAKNGEEPAISALRRHYLPIIKQAYPGYEDADQLERCFQNAFDLVLKASDAGISEPHFLDFLDASFSRQLSKESADKKQEIKKPDNTAAAAKPDNVQKKPEHSETASGKNRTWIVLILLIGLAAVFGGYFLAKQGKTGGSGRSAAIRDYTPDVSLAVCDLRETYGEDALDHTQLLEFSPSYIFSVYTDPNDGTSHYRSYLNWNSYMYDIPQVFYYVDYEVLEETDAGSGNKEVRVRPAFVRYDNYLYDRENKTTEYDETTVTIVVDKDKKPVKFLFPSGNNWVVSSYLGIQDDCEVNYDKHRVSSIKILADDGTVSKEIEYQYKKSDQGLEVIKKDSDLPPETVLSAELDSSGTVMSVSQPYAYTITSRAYDEEGKTAAVEFLNEDYINGDTYQAFESVKYSYDFGFPYIVSKTYTDSKTKELVEEVLYDENGNTVSRKQYSDNGELYLEESGRYTYYSNTVISKYVLNNYENGSLVAALTDTITYDLTGKPLHSNYLMDFIGDHTVERDYPYTEFDDDARVATAGINGETLSYADLTFNPLFSEALRQFQNGNYNDVITALDALSENGYSDSQYDALRADAYEQLAESSGDPEQLRKCVEIYQTIYTNNSGYDCSGKYADVLMKMADASLKAQKTDEAKEYIARSNEIVPAGAKEHRILAIENNGSWEDESGQIYDMFGNLIRRTHYDEHGNLLWYQQFTYDERNCCESMMSYDASGNKTGEFTDFTYTNDGKEIKGFVYSVDTGQPVKYSITSYREDGSMIESVYYFLNNDGYAGKAVYSYDENEKRVTGYQIYNENNKRTLYSVYDYDPSGKMIGLSMYSDNGSYIGYETEE